MKSTVKYLAALALLMSGGAAAAQTADHATFGIEAGYASKNSSAITGLFFQYRLSPTLRIAPSLAGILRHQDLDAFCANIDFHFPFGFSGERVALYPFTGLNYSSWSRHGKLVDTPDVSTRVSRFGVNIGAGAEYYATPTLKLNAELKYTLTSRYHNSVLSVGIGYMF